MKFIAIGELMLRLSPPNYEKIVTTHNFIVNYGGAEANVAVSLANLGVDLQYYLTLTLVSHVSTTLRLMMYTLSTSSRLMEEWDFIILKRAFL